MPEYRTHLLSPIGIPLFVTHLKSLYAEIEDTNFIRQDMWDLTCRLPWMSCFDWCAAALIDSNICPTLISLIILSHRQPDLQWSCIAHHFIWTLRNLAVCGGNRGRQDVLNATPADLRQIFPQIIDNATRLMGDVSGTEIQDYILETWKCWISKHT